MSRHFGFSRICELSNWDQKWFIWIKWPKERIYQNQSQYQCFFTSLSMKISFFNKMQRTVFTNSNVWNPIQYLKGFDCTKSENAVYPSLYLNTLKLGLVSHRIVSKHKKLHTLIMTAICKRLALTACCYRIL